MASYVDNGNKLDWALPFQRTGNFPIDRSSMFSSYADAVKYAAGNASNPDSRGLQGSSYVGQIITVYENDTVNVYKINVDRTLSAIGEGSGGIDIYETICTKDAQNHKIFFTDEAYNYIKTNKPLIIRIKSNPDSNASEDLQLAGIGIVINENNNEILHYKANGGVAIVNVEIRYNDTSSTGSNYETSTIGYLSNLTTTAKSSIVAAINEVNAKPSGGSDVYETNITFSNKKIIFTDEAYAYIRANKPIIIKANTTNETTYLQLGESVREYRQQEDSLLYTSLLEGVLLVVSIRPNETSSTGSFYFGYSMMGFVTIDYTNSDTQIINQLNSIINNNELMYMPVLKHNNDYLPFLGVIYTGDNNNITKFDFGYTLGNTSCHARLTLTENDGLYELTKSYETSNSIGDLSNLTTTAKNNLVAAINEINQGGGTSDYSDLTNKPSINNVTLVGDKTSADLGLASQESITDINSKIPNQASVNNQLADKDFVNSSISTATATFRGNFDSLTTLQATEGDRNDYAFYSHRDSSGNTIYDRYKYVGPKEVILPAGYTQVDRISGNYINLNILPRNDWHFILKVSSAYFAEWAPAVPVFGVQSGGTRYDMYKPSYENPLFLKTTAGQWGIQVSNNDIHTIEVKSNRVMYIDGSLVATLGSTTNLPTIPVYLLGINSNGSAWKQNNVHCYGLTIYDNEENLLMDLVPCIRDQDGSIGVYDLAGTINPDTNSPFYGGATAFAPLSEDKWEYEYSLSNLKLTPAQWSTLNSGLVANVTSNGYDATKTQVLKNINGTLTWVDET